MALKSVLDIDVRDTNFQKFRAEYDKYRRALAGEPEVWRRVNESVDRTRKTWEKVVGSLVAQNVQTKLMAKAQEEADRRTRTIAERWRDIARSTTTAAVKIRDATTSLLKWGSLTGLFTGLLGAGGLFGIERLGLAAANWRRSSLGLGLPVGGQNAFRINFGRLIDPDSFLSSVAGAKMDVTRRVGLMGAGLSEREIGGDTASTGVALLRNLKRIADQTNPAMFAQVIAARRLDQFVSVEDMMRLRSTSGAEFSQLLRSYGRDRPGLELAPDVARKWQDFSTQMSRAGTEIETVFIRGLSALAPGLEKLSAGVSNMVGSLLGAPKLKEWIAGLGESLEKFGKYVGTDEFQQKVRDFAEGVGKMAEVLKRITGFFDPDSWHNAVHNNPLLPKIPESDDPRWRWTAGGWVQVERGSWADRVANLFGSSRGGGDRMHNPGNIRDNRAGGFRHFESDEAGVLGIARQLRLYQNRDHLNTINDIITKYAPPSENDTAAYIKDVAAKTGFAPGQNLDLRDNDTTSRLIAAMVSHEQNRGHYDKYKDQKFVVQILNNTGGNATVSVNGLKAD